VLNCDDYVLKGVYHNGCMTKYLLKSSPKNEQIHDSDLSSNEIAFQNLIHEINDDLVVHKKVLKIPTAECKICSSEILSTST
jgi:hypothetical protein